MSSESLSVLNNPRTVRDYNRAMNRLFAPLALVGSLVLVLGGCANGMFGSPSPSGELPAPITESAAPQFAQPFDANDVMFAQMMIPHHSQAVEMSELAQANTSNPEILALAGAIGGTQQAEINTMQSWLTAAGASDSHMHDMEMPGLADQMTMEDLAASTDAMFDALFLIAMLQHHEGAIVMANTVLASSSNDDVIALARNVIETQTAEIAEMYALLGP
jgi:uncharacterized protein (DUF305 family)